MCKYKYVEISNGVINLVLSIFIFINTLKSYVVSNHITCVLKKIED